MRILTREFVVIFVMLAILPIFGDVNSAGGKRGKFVLRLGEGVLIEFVWIRPGKFNMGSPFDENGRKLNERQHEVTLTKGFWIQTTELTQAQWKAVVGPNPSHFKSDPNFPVEQVSWDDLKEFLRKLNERCRSKLENLKADLPTEAEWEYACRSGSARRWSFGDDETTLGEYAWFVANSGNKTHAAGLKKPNAWGLYDMHGNVWEWCKDWHGEYGGDAVDPKGLEKGRHRVLRGGAWYSELATVRSADRYWHNPSYRSSNVGGRIVLR